MPSSRGCRSSYDCIVKIKGVTTRPILFSQLMRSDGEGAMNSEELFADDRSESESPPIQLTDSTPPSGGLLELSWAHPAQSSVSPRGCTPP